MSKVSTSAVLAYYVDGIRVSVKRKDLCVVKTCGIEARMRPGDVIRHNHTTLVFVFGGFRVVKTVDNGSTVSHWTDKDGVERQCPAILHSFRSKPNANVTCVSAIMAGGSMGIKTFDMSWFIPSADGIQEGWFADVKVNSRLGVFIKVRGDVLDWWWSEGSKRKDLRTPPKDCLDIRENIDLVGPDEYEEVRENEWYR